MACLTFGIRDSNCKIEEEEKYLNKIKKGRKKCGHWICRIVLCKFDILFVGRTVLLVAAHSMRQLDEWNIVIWTNQCSRKWKQYRSFFSLAHVMQSSKLFFVHKTSTVQRKAKQWHRYDYRRTSKLTLQFTSLNLNLAHWWPSKLNQNLFWKEKKKD